VPAAVAQAVQTSLLLFLGEWYLDLTQGTPYPTGVLGKHSQDQADATIRATVSQVQGVQSIASFSSTINPATRAYSVTQLVINTIYGQTEVDVENLNNF
jgi:hypothetical protein